MEYYAGVKPNTVNKEVQVRPITIVHYEISKVSMKLLSCKITNSRGVSSILKIFQ